MKESKDVSKDLANFRYRIFDEYGDVVCDREYYNIPRSFRICLEELLDLIFVSSDFDVDREIF